MVWKALPSPYDSYWVSDDGHVGSTRLRGRSFSPKPVSTPRKLTAFPHGANLWVTIRVEGKSKSFSVAKLVALGFHGPAPANAPYVVQKNGNTEDNRPQNLEYTDDPVAYWARRMRAQRAGELSEGDMRLVGDAPLVKSKE